jgi:hypothetical protein
VPRTLVSFPGGWPLDYAKIPLNGDFRFGLISLYWSVVVTVEAGEEWVWGWRGLL